MKHEEIAIEVYNDENPEGRWEDAPEFVKEQYRTTASQIVLESAAIKKRELKHE